MKANQIKSHMSVFSNRLGEIEKVNYSNEIVIGIRYKRVKNNIFVKLYLEKITKNLRVCLGERRTFSIENGFT